MVYILRKEFPFTVIKKSITYENPFTNQPVTEEHYFHISKADLVEMEVSEQKTTYEKDGETLTGMQAKIQRMIDSQDGRAILEEIKDLIFRSFGAKDGDRFIRTKELRDSFAASEAYSQLLWELCTDATAASDFIAGIVPGNLEEIASEVRERAAQTQTQPQAPTNGSPASPEPPMSNITPHVLTEQELAEIDAEELRTGLATGKFKLK